MGRPRGSINLPLTERWQAMVSPEPMSGCWLWAGAFNNNGYGIMSPARFGVAEGERYAHRVGWILRNGPIPDGLLVLHTCNGGSGGHGCVNPGHMYLGDKRQNAADMIASGRASGGHWFHKQRRVES